jgi:hypothetical protein
MIPKVLLVRAHATCATLCAHDHLKDLDATRPASAFLAEDIHRNRAQADEHLATQEVSISARQVMSLESLTCTPPTMQNTSFGPCEEIQDEMKKLDGRQL